MDTSIIFSGIVFGLLFWFIYQQLPVKGLKTFNTTDFSEALKNKSDKVLIDVREPHELKTGYIKDAVNIPLSQIRNRYDEIPEGKTVLLYCRSGFRSKKAARVLKKKKFKNMVHLRGGIMSWHGEVKHSK
ncbi:rhodanese-like domain-containing protein [Chengkuizengella axinellae]|uniref:Rhodanese-like domain-containing protein n=1 Tax=Chengkuizengella axinellae TaxID=3064388 RepID=A0ABT9J0K9_9BACL|nr:rhodanese-like domain-containing protein [Chengkuizengella sp. 2205SS18-9]MDP5275138.1 rhodanese-like domain-containing protein [Chengkuizengella sp. 2205SS18-9]